MKPVILHTGRSITVEERRRRAEAEDIYRVGRLRLVPPAELSDRAKAHFEQIAAEAFWLDELSCDLLAAYCHAYDRWLDVVSDMDGEAETIVVRGQVRQNPHRQALRQYVDIMCALSSKLGLGNIDRLKLSLPEAQKKEEDPFESFMQKVE